MHKKWLKIAEELSENCIDPNLKIGCVLVKDDEKIAEGWNRVSTGVEEKEARHSKRPAMYYWVEHAERIAVYNAARNGVCTAESTAYVNVSPSSVCTLCLRALIESGVTRIVGNTRELDSKSVKNHSVVNQKMIEEANIETITIQ